MQINSVSDATHSFMPESNQKLLKRVMLFNKQHRDMSTCKYNRINLVFNKNIDCGFENCD